MKNENIVFRSVRMNMDNPQHVKVNEILCNIDKDVYKSKNQFVIDAIEFYVDHYGKETFTKSEEGNRQYICMEDLEKIKAEITEAVLTESRREVIRILGTAISGRGAYQTVAQPDIVSVEEEKELEDDEVVSGLATSWMPEM